MKVSKWIIIAISALIILGVAGYVYEKLTSGRTIDLLNASVADYVRANSELRGKLEAARAEVGELTTGLESAAGENQSLREHLEASQKLITDIIEASLETTEGIDSSLGETEGIRADNLYVARQIREGFKLVERIKRDFKQQ